MAATTPAPGRAAARRQARPQPRDRVRRDVDLTRVIIAVVLVLGALGVAYLGVVAMIARQGLDVRHMVEISLGPKEWGYVGGAIASAAGFLAVLKRTSKTEKMVGYDVPHGVEQAVTAALAAHAQAAGAERDRHHAEQMAALKAVEFQVAATVSELVTVADDSGDHADLLERLVTLLQEAQVQVSYGNPDRLRRAPDPEPAVEHPHEPDPEPVVDFEPEPAGQRVSPDRVWGPSGPPKLRKPGARSAHRASTATHPVVPAPASAPVLERQERHAETLPPLPPLAPARARPWTNLGALTAPSPSTGVQRALAAVDAGAATFDEVITGRPR